MTSISPIIFYSLTTFIPWSSWIEIDTDEEDESTCPDRITPMGITSMSITSMAKR